MCNTSCWKHIEKALQISKTMIFENVHECSSIKLYGMLILNPFIFCSVPIELFNLPGLSFFSGTALTGAASTGAASTG